MNLFPPSCPPTVTWLTEPLWMNVVIRVVNSPMRVVVLLLLRVTPPAERVMRSSIRLLREVMVTTVLSFPTLTL